MMWAVYNLSLNTGSKLAKIKDAYQSLKMLIRAMA